MKVLIADDHTVVREGLKNILRKIDAGINIEEVENGEDALFLISNNNYDLIIMDISMPGKSGLDILKILNDTNKTTRTLILSIHPEEQYAIRAFNLGASGYVSKSSLYEELGNAIKTILAGKKYIPPALAEKIIFDTKDELNKRPHEKLSTREFQILIMLAKGISVKEIANQLFISDKTVSTHRARMLDKMGIKNNAELIRYAIENKLIE